MRADKVKKLYNGMLPCNLYQFFKPAEFQKNPPRQDRPRGQKGFDYKYQKKDNRK